MMCSTQVGFCSLDCVKIRAAKIKLIPDAPPGSQDHSAEERIELVRCIPPQLLLLYIEDSELLYPE